MKLLFSSVFCLLLASSTAFAQSSASGKSSAAERSVLDTETLRFELMTKGDTLALSRLLADDLVYIHSNGLTESKPQHLQAMAAGRLKYSTMQREEAKVRLYGKMALNNGIVHAVGVLNNTPFDIRLRYTAVYQKQHGQWRLLNWQSTRI